MKVNLKLLALIFVCSSSTSSVSAQSGHAGSRSVVLTRVRGWEAQLVQGTPNLARFYWEPMVRRTINTTLTTGHQAIRAPLPVAKIRREQDCNSISSRSVSCHLSNKLLSNRVAESEMQAGCAAALKYQANSGALVSTSNSTQLGVSGRLVSNKLTVKVTHPIALEAHQLSLTSAVPN